MASLNFRAIVFDFDGVIIESVGIKKQSYRQLFEEEFSGHLGKILAYQESRGGVTRRRQFEEIYESILREEPGPGRVDALEERYVGLMFERVISASLVPGAFDFLEKFHQRIDLFVASTTPEDELNHIVRERGLASFFKDVYGAPMRKAEALGLIARRVGCAPGEIVFIGDYPTDREAAESAGVPFIARLGSTDEMENCPEKVRDLTELAALLERMAG